MNINALNQLLFANLKGKFEYAPDEETQNAGRVINDFNGQANLEFIADQLQMIELDYAAGSIGVDLMSQVSVSRIALNPDSSVHHVTNNKWAFVYDANGNLIKKGRRFINMVLLSRS